MYLIAGQVCKVLRRTAGRGLPLLFGRYNKETEAVAVAVIIQVTF
jgi:hypothetical protein